MMYWTIFTCRTLARLGLFITITFWFVFGNLIADLIFDTGSSYAQVIAYESGYRFTTEQTSQSVGWRSPGLNVISLSQLAKVESGLPANRRFVAQLNAGRPARHGPGIHKWATGMSLWLDHWFLCLAFLIATIVTWPRRNRKIQPEPSE